MSDNNPDDAGTLLTNPPVDDPPTDDPPTDDPPTDDPPTDDSPTDDPPTDDPPTDDPPTDDLGEGAPENYETFEMPEGMEVDQQLLDKAVPIFKELNLNQQQAQKLISLQAEAVKESNQGQVEQFNQTLEEWDTAAKNDPEIGGDKFKENLGIAKLGLEKVGTPELTEFLKVSGAGSHPEVIRAFYKIGSLVKEDNPDGGSPGQQTKSREERMYPKE